MPEVRVAFIGVGAMGHPMASRLARASGVDLTTYDAVPAAREAARSIGRVAESLVEAVAEADVVMSMLPADQHVRSLAADLVGLLRPETIYVDFSTIHPATIREVATDLAPRATTVSASCMKSVAAAISGELTLFVGGEQASATALASLLGSMATRVIDVGSLEAAKGLKLVNNLAVASTGLVISEAAVIGARCGISYETLWRALAERGIGGWALHNHILKHTLTDDLGPGNFSVRYMSKDVRLATRMADDLGVERLLGGLILAAYRGTAALGLGEHYHPIVIRWLETSSGTGVRAEPDGALETLVAWVAAAERLITRESLDLASAIGLSPQTAASALNEASAANATLSALLSTGDAQARLELDPATAPIEEARSLAERLDCPALTIETAYDYAIRLTRRDAQEAR